MPSSLLSTGTPCDLRFATCFFSCFVDLLSPSPWGHETSACSVWWSASLPKTPTANHPSSSGCSASRFSRAAISLVPAWRAVSYLEWTAAFPLFSHTDRASDRFAPCLLSVYAGDLFSFVCACWSLQKFSHLLQNRLRWVAEEAFCFLSPTGPPLAPFKRETIENVPRPNSVNVEKKHVGS